MATSQTEISDESRHFIESQKMFFVASAPLSAAGHVNLSPKGLDTFCVLGPSRVAYLDYTGSGVETIAHLRENGRLTIMFCAFEGKPRIVRLYGRGRALLVGSPESELSEPDAMLRADLLKRFNPPALARSIIVLDVDRVSNSCGFGVPLYRFEGERDQLTSWCARKGEAGLAAYQREKNAQSLDGLPGID